MTPRPWTLSKVLLAVVVFAAIFGGGTLELTRIAGAIGLLLGLALTVVFFVSVAVNGRSQP
jgi:hypothetical protein